MPITWTAEADRDLLLILMGAGAGGVKPAIGWSEAVANMKALGYDTTKDGISQRFGKVILKSFKTRLTGGTAPASNNGTPTGTPARTPARTPRKRSAPAKKAKKASPTSSTSDDDDIEADDGTPAAKRRAVGAVRQPTPARKAAPKEQGALYESDDDVARRLHPDIKKEIEDMEVSDYEQSAANDDIF